MKALPLVVLLAAAAPVLAEPPGRPASFAICAACHSTEAGQPNRIGPNLHGVVGRRAGSLPGFAYSPAMKNAGFVWTPEKLLAFIQAPQAVVHGNRMPYGGQKDKKSAADIVTYLRGLDR